MYKLELTETFSTRLKKIISKNKTLQNKVIKALKNLETDPFYPSLRTHKVNIRNDKSIRYSSWVTGDLRIIWDFDLETKEIIILMTIGGHDGGKGVYK